MAMGRSAKLLQFLKWRMRVTMQDDRMIVGEFMAFDKHLNMVLGDAEEFRRVGKGKCKEGEEPREEKRPLGLVVIRGENVVSISVEGPPQPEGGRARKTGIAAGTPGPGIARAAGRAMPSFPIVQAPAGLTGPVRGVGGPGVAQMQPMGYPTAGRGVPPPMGFPPQMPPPGMPPFMGQVPPPMGGRAMPPAGRALPPRPQ